MATLPTDRYQSLLVLASFPPDGGGGGGVILRSLFKTYPAERITWLALAYNNRRSPRRWRPEIPVKSFRFWYRGVCDRKCFHNLWAQGLHRLETIVVKRWALERIRESAPQSILAIIDQRTLLSQYAVLQQTTIPFHVTVHDDPSLSFSLANWKPPRGIENAFAWLYTNAQTRDCVSNRMANYYRERFGKDALTLPRAIESLRSPAFRAPPSDTICLRICMGGIGNCPPPFPNDILEALNILRATRDVSVEFHAFDRTFKEHFGVIVPPVLGERDFDAYLENMHIGFAVDPLSPKGREFAATSLPTKVVTYISKGIPFVYQGPKESTVGDILQQYPCGLIVESVEPQRLADGFLEVLRRYLEMSKAAIDAGTALFSAVRLREVSMSRFLDISGRR